MPDLRLVGRTLCHGDRVLDPWAWTWSPGAPDGGDPIGMAEAAAFLHRARLCRMIPVSVVGPRNPGPEEYDTALRLGRALGAMGLTVLCGGKTGVMEAAAKGVGEGGGFPVALLPDDEWQAANDFVALPLATGLGPARNVLIARACVAMIAVGGHLGTITEVAYALHFDRPVIGLPGAPDIDGVQHAADVAEAVEMLLPILLRLPERVG